MNTRDKYAPAKGAQNKDARTTSHVRSPKGLSGRYTAPALLAGLLITLSACGAFQFGGDASEGSGAGSQPDIAKLSSKQEVSCAFYGADELVTKPTCYDVTVPEDWSNPAKDDRVVLHVAVFSANGTADAKPGETSGTQSGGADPLIYLDGGPGGETLNLLSLLEPNLVAPYVADRDVIIYDQRGIGVSAPDLSCPEIFDASTELAATDPADRQTDAKLIAAKNACRDRLVDDGVNLAAFNSISSSHDIEAIRTTLGYKQLNLLGVSYGTRLAQTYMRSYPASISSVVIDSVLPTDENFHESIAVTGQRSLQMVFDSCADDPACSEAHPTLQDDFFTLLDQLDKEPASVQLFNLIDPAEAPTEALVDGNDLLGLVFGSLYDKRFFSMLPQLVSDSLQGQYSGIQILASLNSTQARFISDGMHLSVECNEEIPFESADQMDENVPDDSDYDRTSVLNGTPTLFEACRDWPAGKAPAIENEPVESDIATLVMTGSFDPITPPSYAQQVASHLPNSFYVEFPTEGHGVSSSECGISIVSEFLGNPDNQPDLSCVDTVPPPQWVLS